MKKKALLLKLKPHLTKTPIDDLAALENEAFDTEDDGNFSESDNFEEANEDSNEDDENSDKDPA